MKIISAAGTHVGKVRSNNEDNYYLNGIYKKNCKDNIRNDESVEQKYRNIYAVCDGVGGESAGELASLMAVEILSQCSYKNILEYIETANKSICSVIKKTGKRMGSTLALLKIEADSAEIYNVGDSRVYMFRKGQLVQLSKNHTMVQQMLDAGIITYEESKKSKQRHVITQCLGIFPDEFTLSPYVVSNIYLETGDIFVLCSDGVTDMLDDGEIKNTLLNNDSPENIVNDIIASSLDKGGKDNITVVVVKIQ